MNSVEALFQQHGGVFCTSSSDLAARLKNIRAFVFDWDGVFNNASKNEQKSSTFNEADSMGTNLLRFGHYLLNGKLPATAIISGERNGMAFYFTEREHFDASYYKVPDKIVALKHFCEQHQITPDQVCYFYDDVLDLSIAEACGARVLIHRKANPLFTSYVVKHNMADYITGAESGNYAVREGCELILGLQDVYDRCIDERKNFSETYADYFRLRQSAHTAFFTFENGHVIAGSSAG